MKGLTGADLLRRQELNDVYENVKETLESQNVTLDKIIFAKSLKNCSAKLIRQRRWTDYKRALTLVPPLEPLI